MVLRWNFGHLRVYQSTNLVGMGIFAFDKFCLSQNKQKCFYTCTNNASLAARCLLSWLQVPSVRLSRLRLDAAWERPRRYQLPGIELQVAQSVVSAWANNAGCRMSDKLLGSAWVDNKQMHGSAFYAAKVQ